MSTKENPATETWYVLRRYTYEIEPREVTKHTAQTVWFKDLDWHGKWNGRIRQERKGGDWFPSRDEAIAAMRHRLERELEQANNNLSLATKRLKDFTLKYAGRDPSPTR